MTQTQILKSPSLLFSPAPHFPPQIPKTLPQPVPAVTAIPFRLLSFTNPKEATTKHRCHKHRLCIEPPFSLCNQSLSSVPHWALKPHPIPMPPSYRSPSLPSLTTASTSTTASLPSSTRTTSTRPPSSFTTPYTPTATPPSSLATLSLLPSSASPAMPTSPSIASSPKHPSPPPSSPTTSSSRPIMTTARPTPPSSTNTSSSKTAPLTPPLPPTASSCRASSTMPSRPPPPLPRPQAPHLTQPKPDPNFMDWGRVIWTQPNLNDQMDQEIWSWTQPDLLLG